MSAPAKTGIVRPADAAGLVLIRAGKSGAPEILMGRRPARMGFLPGIHVVPGGRVDPEDALADACCAEPHPAIAAQLTGRRQPAAYLNAALRETFEETGLLVGRSFAWSKDTPEHPSPMWRGYRTAGLAPDYAGMDYLCRAITPVRSRRRFNTCFFLADGARAMGTLAGNGELEELAWHRTAALSELTLVDVTEYVLKTALERWHSGAAIGSQPPKLLNYRNDVLTLSRMRQATR